MFDMDPRRRAVVGPALTLILISLTELLTHLLQQDRVGVTLFLLCLVPIAYAGLRSGFANSLVCTGMLSLYTLHYVGDHAAVIATDAQALTSFAIVLFLGAAMGWPMSRVGAREARLQSALEARARDLEARNRELVNANASLEAFGYVVSHDLKEPVRALENYLDVARQEWPSEESRAYVEEAYAANRRLMRLLEGLLSYSRTSSLATTSETVPLRDLVLGEACSAQYGPLLQERGAELSVAEDLPAVIGDRVILAQLFGNLILNALRHHPRSGGRVWIRPAEAADDRAHVVVEDDGKGFPPDVLDRFGRLQSDRPATIKTGFGLAIAHRAAQRLGGRLWLDQRPGGGAVAHVELPKAPLSQVRKGRFDLLVGDDPSESLPRTR